MPFKEADADRTMDLAVFLICIMIVLLVSISVVRNYLDWYCRLDKVYAAGKYKDDILHGSVAIFARNRCGSFIPICIFSCCFVISALSLAGMAAFEFYRKESVRSWPTFPGTILELKKTDRGDPERDLGKLEYQFVVDNRLLKSDFVRFGHNEDYLWKEMASKYAVGKKVAVFANPIHPQTSFLEVPDNADSIRKVLLAGFLLFCGVALRVWFDQYTKNVDCINNKNRISE